MTSLAPWAIGRATVDRRCASSRSAREGGSLDYGIRWSEWLTEAPVVRAAGVFLCALWRTFATVPVGADSLFRSGSDRYGGEPPGFRDVASGFSASRFCVAICITLPFGSNPAPNALHTRRLR